LSSHPPKHSQTFGHTLRTGLLVTAIVLFGKWCIEHHSLYRSLQFTCYSWLQSRLRPPLSRDDLSVVILDIHELAPVETEVNGKKFTVTPRAELLNLIKVVAKNKPSVIGVDIDFSPNEFGYLDTDDPRFFRDLMKIKADEGIPIFVGIKRSQNKSPEKWLGVTEFASLAATIMIPPNDDRKMLRWVEVPQSSGDGSKRGQSMCSALAQALMKREQSERQSHGWFLTQESEEQVDSNLKAGEFLVDFSALKLLMDLRLTTRNSTTVSDLGWTLKDKAVLIGDGETSDARDTFPVPDLNHRRGIPGIFKHASGVYTLIKAPLYEMTTLGRLTADFALSLMVLVPLAIVRWMVTKRAKSPFAEHTAIGVFTVLATLVVLIIGVMFVHLTRVMWDDFLFVIVALWLHTPIAALIDSSWTAAKKLPKIITDIFSDSERTESS
jgi:CHASE2 domain-containing sensor protein